MTANQVCEHRALVSFDGGGYTCATCGEVMPQSFGNAGDTEQSVENASVSAAVGTPESPQDS